MLRLLLDEHISPDVAAGVRRRHPRASVDSVLDWQAGRLAGLDDSNLLAQAFAHKCSLVTYDQSTIIPILKDWAEQGIDHGGLIFVDDRTIAPNDFGGLIRALGRLWDKDKNKDWTNQVVYLTKPPR
jgi:hypothetical protein